MPVFGAYIARQSLNTKVFNFVNCNKSRMAYFPSCFPFPYTSNVVTSLVDFVAASDESIKYTIQYNTKDCDICATQLRRWIQKTQNYSTQPLSDECENTVARFGME